MTELKPIQGLFAVEVPEEAYGAEIIGSKIWAFPRFGHGWKREYATLPPGSYEIICTTSNATEQQAAEVVDSHWDTELCAMRYGILKNNSMEDFLPTEALSRLLRANGLHPDKQNYLLIKKK